MGHTWGFGLVSGQAFDKTGGSTCCYFHFSRAIAGAGAFYYQWHLDGYQITNLKTFTPDYAKGEGWLHRVDHIAHIGGLIVGALTAFFTRNSQFVNETGYSGYGYSAAIVALLFAFHQSLPSEPAPTTIAEMTRRAASPWGGADY